ncbi:transketolase [Zavarzinia compransoris]|uniref:Transketolase n=1 Tax=Zavarzinia compransoris TaxID=1264899 RepID=A0A317E3L9_9PROT|nr:transketolase [Zavarzinia compransoris]PWR20746.1 transketolase [Zavarzinia compransoris]TDP44421.1 transketolase [Zavarzinia compransoris]
MTETTSPLATTAPAARDLANAIRALAMDAVEAAKSGHPGMPMGMADAATALFTEHLRYDPANPAWPDRDRFILSAGHGSMLLYALLYLTGYPDIDLDEIKKFRQLGARTAGHPEYGHAAGIETTTGPLGQGISNAVGFAMAEAHLRARFGEALVNHFTYVIAGDGCLMEGVSQEAITLAGHLKLNKLIVLWDDNRITIDGATDLSTSEDVGLRFTAAGWAVDAVDGHDAAAVSAAIARARLATDRPTLIACRTTIGFGAPTKAGKSSAHGSPLGAAEIEGARKALGWPYGPFEIPEAILDAWRAAAKARAAEGKAWGERFLAAPKELQEEFENAFSGFIPAKLIAEINAFKAKISADKPSVATRKSSELALEVINKAVPTTIGGSADLTGSNNTLTKGLGTFAPGSYEGRYVYWGVREHGMAAAMNGMALHGGVIPYGGTFLAFADYCRPSIRLAALMGIRSIFVMTHDSIGLGEDGPTHQPVEQIASLRAIPGLNVFRPCDTVETAEAWAVAVASQTTPSVLALSRQNLPTLRDAHTDVNLTAKGAYELLPAAGGLAEVSLFASGSEVEITVKARDILAHDGIRARVVSVPCMELFAAQEQAYQETVVGNAPCVGVEAGIAMGWEPILGVPTYFVGMDGFGASAPAPELYKHFGITAEAVADAAKAAIGKIG